MKAKESAFSLRRVLFTLHLWMGLGSGLLFSLVCATGFYLAIHPQLESRARSHTPASAQEVQLSAEEIVAKVTPIAVPGRIEIPARKGELWKLRGEKGSLYVNPSTGEVLEPLWGDSYNWVKKLHRFLLLDHKIGRPITGAATLMYIFLMFSGVYLWWKKSARNPMRGLTFKRGAGWKRTFYDAHLALGMYAMIPLTLMAVTGLWWSYREPTKAVIYWTLDGAVPEAPQKKKKEEKKEEEIPPRTDLPYASLLETVEREFPYEGIVRLNLPDHDATDITILKTREPGFWRMPTRDEVTIDLASGRVLKRKLFADKTRAEQFTSLIYDIHTGYAWGDLTLVLYLVACVVGTSLPITGTVMWFNRMQGQRRSREIMARRQRNEAGGKKPRAQVKMATAASEPAASPEPATVAEAPTPAE